LVIEAKEKSGSLITAEWGKKQHKSVFAVPGSIYSTSSKGCNWLLKKGGLACDSALDILNALGIAPVSPKTAAIANSVEEQKILDTLKEGAADIDQIILITKLPAPVVMSIIPVMEINNLIRDLGNGEYCLNN
jgi:Predicted Rossmann fold nucleotide-binding protein involved in DNA uptake